MKMDLVYLDLINEIIHNYYDDVVPIVAVTFIKGYLHSMKYLYYYYYYSH